MEGADIVNESRSTEEGNQEKSPTGDSSSSEFPTFVLKHRDIDRGWAWLAMCSSFFSEILLGLCFPMVGIMYVYQLETFGKGPVLTACIGSLMTSLLVMCADIFGLGTVMVLFLSWGQGQGYRIKS